MSHIRSKHSRPEMRVRRFLHERGFRYTLHSSSLPGSPDMVLRKYRTVVMVHGCFWHRHSCPNGQRVPRSNAAYWTAKFVRNCERDMAALQSLAEKGWRVIVVWECQTRHSSELALALAPLLDSRRDGTG